MALTLVAQEKFLRGLLLGLGFVCIAYVFYLWKSQVQEGFALHDILKNKAVVEFTAPTGIFCKPSIVDTSGNKIWYCDNILSARRLISGPSSTSTWLNQFDQVCVAEDKAGTQYTCMDFTYYPDDDGRWALKGDYEETCGSVYGAYTDLSNNATTMVNMRGTIADQIGTTTYTQERYNEMLALYKCGQNPTGSDKAACDALAIGRDKMGSEAVLMSGLFDKIKDPARVSLEQRATAYINTAGFKCKVTLPPADVQYPKNGGHKPTDVWDQDINVALDKV
jgi:hypothetical protein